MTFLTKNIAITSKKRFFNLKKFLVETAGIEPASEKTESSFSSCVVCEQFLHLSNPQTGLNCQSLDTMLYKDEFKHSFRNYDAGLLSCGSEVASCITLQQGLFLCLRLSIFPVFRRSGASTRFALELISPSNPVRPLNFSLDFSFLRFLFESLSFII